MLRRCYLQGIFGAISILIRPLYGSDNMLVLITYDVSTADGSGKKRLRRVAKQCVDYGVRVQNSVFECELDPAQCRRLKQKLIEEINEKTDSLRFYYLGDIKKAKVEHYGVKQTIRVDEPLIF